MLATRSRSDPRLRSVSVRLLTLGMSHGQSTQQPSENQPQVVMGPAFAAPAPAIPAPAPAFQAPAPAFQAPTPTPRGTLAPCRRSSMTESLLRYELTLLIIDNYVNLSHVNLSPKLEPRKHTYAQKLDPRHPASSSGKEDHGEEESLLRSVYDSIQLSQPRSSRLLDVWRSEDSNIY